MDESLLKEGVGKLDRTLAPEVKEAMFAVMYHWPMYEMALTSQVIYCFDMDVHSGPILLGTMDARTKIDRLIAYAKTTGEERFIQVMKDLRATHTSVSKTRNILTHCPYLGRDLAYPEFLIFATLKQRVKGKYMVEALTLQDLKACAAFASHGSKILATVLRDQQQKESRERKRAGRPPIRTRKDRSRRRAQQQS